MRGVREVSPEQMVVKFALEFSSFAESANQNSFTVLCVGEGSLVPQKHCLNGASSINCEIKNAVAFQPAYDKYECGFLCCSCFLSSNCKSVSSRCFLSCVSLSDARLSVALVPIRSTKLLLLFVPGQGGRWSLQTERRLIVS